MKTWIISFFFRNSSLIKDLSYPYDKSLTCQYRFPALFSPRCQMKKWPSSSTSLCMAWTFFVKYLNWAQATLGFRKPQVMPGATFRTTRKLSRGLSSRDLMVNGSCSSTTTHSTILQHFIHFLTWALERARFFQQDYLSYLPLSFIS